MTFKIFDLSGQQLDISNSIIRGSIQCRRCFSIDLSSPFGTSELDFQMYDYISNGNRFKPVSGQRIRWIADDGSNVILFDGIIINPTSEYVGKEGSNKKLTYKIHAEDASYLLTKKIAAETTYKNMTAGSIIDQLAVYADSRITIASNNDAGMSIGEQKLARKNVKDRVEELAKGSGLYVWIDENWVLHHKAYSTILSLSNDEDFDIDDISLFYKDLTITEDIDNLATRVHCIGSEMDTGQKNTQNRKQGKQKRVDQVVTKTSSLAKINIVRARLGFSNLPLGTNVDNLGSEVPGIIEKDYSAQEVYSSDVLDFLAEEYLSRYEDPWLKGEVTYIKPGVQVGKSVVINSQSRQVQAVLPVVEVLIETSGGRKYYFKCNLNGPSSFKKLKQKKQVLKAAKAELLIKPKPPTMKKHKSIDQNTDYATKEVHGEVLIRSEKQY